MSRLHALVLLCACCLLCAAAVSASPPADAEGQFILGKSVVVSGEPVWVTFRLVNPGTTPLHVSEAVSRGGIQRCEYGFLARDSAGRVISPPPVMIVSGFTRDVSVVPGAAYQQRLFLPDWLGLLRPGRYTLRCWTGPSPGVAGWSAADPSKDENKALAGAEDLPLTVLPPDKRAISEVIQTLGRQTQSNDGAARDEAAISLAAISDPRVVPPLAALILRPDPPGRLGSQDEYLREDSEFAAVLGLSHFPSDVSAKALLAAINGSDDDLRRDAGDALRRMHYAGRVLPALRQEMRVPSPAVRAAAIRAVASLQDPRGFAPLVNALHDPVEVVRVEAAKALGTLRDRRAVPVLRSHFHDPDLTLRLACIESLTPLRHPILAQWLTPIVRAYAFPGGEQPSLEAMLVLRRDCDDWTALAGCLNWNDPRPSHAYNFFLITQMDACQNGLKYGSRWSGGGDTPEGIENNRKVLAAIKLHLPAQ